MIQSIDKQFDREERWFLFNEEMQMQQDEFDKIMEQMNRQFRGGKLKWRNYHQIIGEITIKLRDKSNRDLIDHIIKIATKEERSINAVAIKMLRQALLDAISKEK